MCPAITAPLPPKSKSSSLTAKLIIHNDPCWLGAVGPALSWAEECWRAATASPCAHLSVGTLSKLWHQMSGRHAADWARCRGPLNAAILSLQRLSWRMVGPFTWLTDQNVEVSPLKCSPKLIADMMRDALRRSHQRAYASKCGGRFEGRRACMDTVVAMLKGKVLQPSGKGALYALVCRSF